MRKILALILIGLFLVSCTNVRLSTEKKETVITAETKQPEINITPQQVIETTTQEIMVEDFGDII